MVDIMDVGVFFMPITFAESEEFLFLFLNRLVKGDFFFFFFPRRVHVEENRLVLYMFYRYHLERKHKFSCLKM